MQEWETEMDKGSQPTATQKAVWTYLLKTTPFNKTSLNKGSSQIIQKHKINPTFNSYQLRECDRGINSGGEWFHTCTFELP